MQSNEFQIFSDYVLLKAHFNTMDFYWDESRRYSKLKPAHLEKRNDRKFFKMFEKYHKSNRDQWIEYLISAFLVDPSIWIGGILNEDIMKYHTNRLRILGAIKSFFERECEIIEEYLYDHNIHLQDALLTTGTKDPIICKVKGISLESLTLMHRFTDWAALWFPINPLLKNRRMNIHKYVSLLRISEEDITSIEKLYQNLAQI